MLAKIGNKTRWFLLLLVTLTAFAVIFIPVWLIQPFAPQTPGALSISFYLKSWSPILTVVLALAAVALAVFIARNASRWYFKIPLIVPLVLVFVFTWFARQNHFLWMFSPLQNSRYARVAEADFIKDDEMVMAVTVNGEAVAYPVRWLAYHHIVQDVVGGTPITATY